MLRAAVVISLLGFGSVLCSNSTAAEFQCPVSSELSATPLPAEIAASIPKGVSLEQPDQLQSAIILLREHGMASDDIINRLISLYCPYAASDTTASSEQKTAQVEKFAAQATAAVLSEGEDTAILFNVPLSPDVAEIAMQRARAAGVTTEEWIADTVGAAVK
jgi:hypothetical protein